MRNALIYIIFITAFAISGCAQQELKQNITNKTYSYADIAQPDKTPVPTHTTVTQNNSGIQALPVQKSKGTVLYYFYSPYCFASNAISPKIDELENRFNKSVLFERYNILGSGNLELYNFFILRYNITEKGRVVPIVFFGNRTLSGMFEINESLEELINKNKTR